MPPSLLLRALKIVMDRVEGLGLSPVIAGGLAVAYWGHPRSTQDIDLAVLVSDHAIFESGLLQANLLPVKGGRVVDLGFVKVSQWKIRLEEDYIDCEVDFLISDSSYHKLAIERAVNCEFSGIDITLRVLRCEDLLLFKAASGRLIDLADIKTLYELQRESLDFDYLEKMTQPLGLKPQFWLSN